MNTRVRNRAITLITAVILITAVSGRLKADTGACGGASTTLPFTDVAGSNIFFCSIAEAYFSGLTNGTSATTYSPSDPVTREQMAAFVTRSMNQSLKRGSKRAALNQFWTPKGPNSLGLTNVDTGLGRVASDGADLWVASGTSGKVSRVRASDGRKMGEFSGGDNTSGVLVAMGKVFVTGQSNPGTLYVIDPTQDSGPLTTLATNLGATPEGIAFDGQRIWTANFNLGGSVSIVALNPVTVTNVSVPGAPVGLVYDGANMWVTDASGATGTLKKLDSNGKVLMTVPVGANPFFPVFDGTNIWVPNFLSNNVTVVRATGPLAGTVLATLTGNGLISPVQAAFDGERILVANRSGDSVSVWKASDLTPIGTFSTGAGTSPGGVCSDGLNFWLVLESVNKLARF